MGKHKLSRAENKSKIDKDVERIADAGHGEGMGYVNELEGKYQKKMMRGKSASEFFRICEERNQINKEYDELIGGVIE